MTDTKYDKLLKDFLDDEAKDRSRGVTKSAIYKAVERVANRQIEQDQRLDRYGRRLRSLEREAERRSEAEEGPNWRADVRDVTGTHDLAVMKKQHDEMREDAKWGRRQGLIVVGSIVASLIVLTIAGCAAYAVVGFKAPHAQQGGK